MNEILQINLPEEGEHQLRPFQSMVEDVDLFCGSRDGRLFQLDPLNYKIKKTISLHNSWISSVQATPDFIVTSSYDGSIALIPKEEIINSDEPKFTQKFVHNDYILSMTVKDSTIFTSSSEPKISKFKITESGLKHYASIHTETSAHCIKYLDNLLLIGEANGKISYYDLRSEVKNIHNCFSHESCIKVISCNENTVCAGYLDGKIFEFDKRTWKAVHEYSDNGFPINISCTSDSLVAIYSDGVVHDYYNVTNPLYNFNVSLISGIHSTKNNSLFHVCDTSGNLRKFDKNNEICKLEPSVAADEIQRLGHNTDILVRNSNDEVYLIDGKTLKISEKFGKVDFREKVKELTKKPYLYFPISFNVSTGIPRMIISNFLPKLNDPSFKESREALKNIVLSLRENKIPILVTNSNGIPLYKSTSDKRLPFWMRYCIENHLSQDIND
ncbi:hypothetical protein TVAG_318370 [Trichomonas vaginalis G3]|uniref:Uncharacterized protein n=1 Tax=Trichomonas vaginalis (strain ATCC PRA-98 / G3) TaxID=412133 RepID=A2G3M3_TRIV3|nr:WD40 repeat-like family [Trichomonas vaginalis G3]EAX88246.1 hypothetical protein TVAG_318370 [Trichomonas vaginalis G3]KAI5517588.1 WD40 repeat-like family [Trichomonas vaginalis G3]|eukprot:XP_001301176.1 hypothetical protein [Trichomonas vaginalis G3]